MNARILYVLAVATLITGACDGDDAAETTTATGPATTDTQSTVPATPEPPATPAAPTTTPATEAPTTMPATTAAPETTAVPPTVADPVPTTLPPELPVECETVMIETGGVTIEAERCTPMESFTPWPAAVVLNGCGGYEADGEITAATVRALAERGIVGLRIDFLAAEPAPPDTYCEAGPVIAAVQPLLQAVVDGVATLRSDPAIDPDRIATASYSLGALAAIAADLGGAGLTTVDPIGLSAAALLSYPNQLPTIPTAAGDGALPPLFLMTGENDTIAPPADTQALADAATAGGVPVEVVIVPDQDHPWRGEAAVVAAAAMADFLFTQIGG